MTLSTIKCLLVSSYAVDTLVTGIAYGLGLYGLLSHKVSVHQWFTYLLLGSILTRIVLAYLNILNLLVFLLKVVTYLYARYVLSLLFTVLLVPPPSRRQ